MDIKLAKYIPVFIEFIKLQISACMFGVFLLVLIFFSRYVFLDPNQQYFSFYRYDFLFISAVLFQIFLLLKKHETISEFMVIILFHLLAFGMEVFKVYVGSWLYPEPSVISIASVPLFAGFMYSAVGSYIARLHKNFQIQYQNFPPYIFSLCLVTLVYMNFFTHHYIFDLRWVLLISSIYIFRKTKLYFSVGTVSFSIHLLFLFVFLSVLIWIAENIATYSNIWLYPNQILEWKMVSYQKILAWYLLMLLSFVLVVLVQKNKKHLNDY